MTGQRQNERDGCERRREAAVWRDQKGERAARRGREPGRRGWRKPAKKWARAAEGVDGAEQRGAGPEG